MAGYFGYMLVVLPTMSKEEEEHESRLLALPDAPLTLVLRHLPQKQRLSNCALSCRALAAIATKATDDITLSSSRPAKHDQLLQWLVSHGQHVTRLSLSCRGGGAPRPPAKMAQLLQACPNLQKLELYAWHVDCAAFDPPSTPSALQQLQLSYCDIAGGQHLAALQRTLQHLTLNSFCCATDPVATVDALLQLRQLTALVAELDTLALSSVHPQPHSSSKEAMHAAVGSSLSSHLSGLSRLQHLILHLPTAVSTEFVTALSALTGLTALKLNAAGSGGTLTSLSSLSSLRHLDLDWRSEVNPELLAGMSQLQLLKLSFPAFGPSIPAAAYTGLAAHCSSLTSLGCCVPAAAWGHVFDSARPLPRLQALTLLSFAAGAGGGDSRVGLTEQQVAAVVECCTGLQHLKLPKGLQPGGRLTPLKRLAGLTELDCGSASSDAVADMAQLRQLRSLTLFADSQLSYKDCYPLLGLRGLTELCLIGLDHGMVDISARAIQFNEQGRGRKIGVWELLLFQLNEVERVGPWAYWEEAMRLCGVDPYDFI